LYWIGFTPYQMDSVDSAVAMLLKAGEVELAYALAIAGKADNPDVAALALSRKCEAQGFDDLAVALLATIKDSQTQVIPFLLLALMVRCSPSRGFPAENAACCPVSCGCRHR
jgi:hypothetical protein